MAGEDNVVHRTPKGGSVKKKHLKMKHRAMSMVIPQSIFTPNEDIPPAASLPPSAKRGYLWKLSGRRVLQSGSWKRKYFVLAEDRLYYYETEHSKGLERGCGIIELRYFQNCAEAPLTDLKKATNVFLLIAAERGFFDQGRCYLSAETLSEMKDWVGRVRAALEDIDGRRHGTQASPAQLSSLGKDRDKGPPGRRPPSRVRSPDGSVVDSESIQRSNSTSALSSQSHDTRCVRRAQSGSVDCVEFDRVWFLNLPQVAVAQHKCENNNTRVKEEEHVEEEREEREEVHTDKNVDNSTKRRGKLREFGCVIF